MLRRLEDGNVLMLFEGLRKSRRWFGKIVWMKMPRLLFNWKTWSLAEKICARVLPDAKFKMVKAIKREIPQHHRADFNGTTLVIATQIPALRHNRVETGFDWYEFRKLLKGL